MEWLTKLCIFFNRLLLSDLEAVGLGGDQVFIACTRHGIVWAARMQVSLWMIFELLCRDGVGELDV